MSVDSWCARIQRPLTVLLCCAVSACGAAAAPTLERPSANDPFEVVDARTGAHITWPAFVAQLRSARVIYIGEQHDRAEDHRAQLAVLELLRGEIPPIAVGLEMVSHPFQPVLDEYGGGGLGEAALLERLEWPRRWGFDFGLYRPIFELAAREGMPLIALNAPAEVTRVVAREGLDALEEEVRELLPELDLEDDAHRALVMEALAGHAHGDESSLERFYLAQVIWDETMAARTAATLESGRAGQIVVLAGVMHVRRGLGIPARAARRGASPHLVLLPVTRRELGTHLESETPEADFYLVLNPPPEQVRGVPAPPRWGFSLASRGERPAL